MSKYLLDTNIISETRKIRPNLGVMEFLNNAKQEDLFLSVLTIGELRKGIKLKFKSDPLIAGQLDIWVNGIETTFADRIMQVTVEIARLWGELSAIRSLSVIDTLLAATAIKEGLILVTRNAKDIKTSGVSFIDPFNKKNPFCKRQVPFNKLLKFKNPA